MQLPSPRRGMVRTLITDLFDWSLHRRLVEQKSEWTPPFSMTQVILGVNQDSRSMVCGTMKVTLCCIGIISFMHYQHTCTDKLRSYHLVHTVGINSLQAFHDNWSFRRNVETALKRLACIIEFMFENSILNIHLQNCSSRSTRKFESSYVAREIKISYRAAMMTSQRYSKCVIFFIAVVEAFFLNDNNQYVEIELCP